MLKTFITKSRAGHYTVTIQTDKYSVLYKRHLIDNLQSARWFAEEFHKQMPTAAAGTVVSVVAAEDNTMVLHTSSGSKFYAQNIEQLHHMLRILDLDPAL